MWLCRLCNNMIIDFFVYSCFVAVCVCVCRWFNITEAFVLSHNFSSSQPIWFLKAWAEFSREYSRPAWLKFLTFTGKTEMLKNQHILTNKWGATKRTLIKDLIMRQGFSWIFLSFSWQFTLYIQCNYIINLTKTKDKDIWRMYIRV